MHRNEDNVVVIVVALCKNKLYTIISKKQLYMILVLV